MKRLRPALPLVSIMMLAGCVSGPQDCDPTRTLFLDGIACAVGGGYQQRQADLANQQRVAEGQAYAARQEAAQAERQQAAEQARVRNLRAAVARQDRELAMLRRELDAARAQRRALDAEGLRAAQARLEEAERIRPATSAELAEREAAQERARAAIRALAGL